MKYPVIVHILFLPLMILLFPAKSTGKAAGQTEECRDHSSFSRLKGYYPFECSVKDSSSFIFPVDKKLLPGFGDSCRFSGRVSRYHYRLKEGNPPIPQLLIFKELEDSLRYAYGYVASRKIAIGDTGNYITGRIARDNFTTWVMVNATNQGYDLTFVDRMIQIRLLTATQMYEQLMKRDTVTLDICFDDDTSTVIPASIPLVEQLYLMLKDHPDLKISIQSHSSTWGDATGNKIVTANRAKEVLDMMTARGIDKKRMTSCGWGGDHPIADNATEEGRARNRRIVIVRK